MTVPIGTTQPDAIDYLLALIRALPSCAATAGVQVSDGNTGARQANTFVSVGSQSGQSIQSNGSAWQEVGFRQREEQYQISLWVSVIKPGGQVEQKVARDAAYLIWKAIDAALIADPTLGGLLSGGWAINENPSLQETTEENAARGRSADLTWDLRIKTRIRSS